MDVQILDNQGKPAGETTLPDAIFGVAPQQALVHQAVVRDEAGQRLGSASTKTRSEVRGGGRKPWRQKHTGRARHGSRRSPIWRTGGVTFGPHPRDYHLAMPRKMWRKAMFSALSSKAQLNRLIVVAEFRNEKISTKDQVAFLDVLRVDSSALYVTEAPTEELLLSIRNVPGVEVATPNTLSVRDVVVFDHLIFDTDAVAACEVLWGQS
ncbi:MAG: 50S ribosomal protein L4 [Chloroflexi bacterium]|nr:50S ribosomal protein L4 [Chloroflexota bacterium]